MLNSLKSKIRVAKMVNRSKITDEMKLWDCFKDFLDKDKEPFMVQAKWPAKIYGALDGPASKMEPLLKDMIEEMDVLNPDQIETQSNN